MKFEIKNRWFGAVQFECELGAEFEAEGFGVRLGAAVELALKAGAHLRCADLSGADLRCADLSGAQLHGAHLRCADLSGTDLRCADLSGADLSGTDLRCADLSGAYLCDANLRGADLSGAYLCGAYLSGADLCDAQLCGAHLRGADLRGAHLRGAYLSNAYLSDGIKLVGQRPVFIIGPIGSRSDSVLFFLTDAGIKVRAGCFFGGIDEFRAAVSAGHSASIHGREYGLACDMAELHAELWVPEVAAEPEAVSEAS